MKVWNWNNKGQIVAGSIDVSNMEHARTIARQWNRDEKRAEMQIALITDTPVQAHATKITAII